MESADLTHQDADIPAALLRYRDRFTGPEMQVASLVLIAKIKSGIATRFNHLIDPKNETPETFSGRGGLLELKNRINEQEASVLMGIARSLGVSDARFREIKDFIYTNETNF